MTRARVIIGQRRIRPGGMVVTIAPSRHRGKCVIIDPDGRAIETWTRATVRSWPFAAARGGAEAEE